MHNSLKYTVTLFLFLTIFPQYGRSEPDPATAPKKCITISGCIKGLETFTVINGKLTHKLVKEVQPTAATNCIADLVPPGGGYLVNGKAVRTDEVVNVGIKNPIQVNAIKMPARMGSGNTSFELDNSMAPNNTAYNISVCEMSRANRRYSPDNYDPNVIEAKSKCDMGDANSCFNGGILLFGNQKPGPWYHTGHCGNALPFFENAAKLGHLESMLLTGLCYGRGEDFPSNINEAIKWLKKAEEQKNPEAAFYLGLVYWKGVFPNVPSDDIQRISPDLKLALNYLNEALNLGFKDPNKSDLNQDIAIVKRELSCQEATTESFGIKMESMVTTGDSVPAFAKRAHTKKAKKESGHLESGGSENEECDPFYYGSSSGKPDYPGAKDCALKLKQYHILTMLYANGYGVDRDLKKALAYACLMPGKTRDTFIDKISPLTNSPSTGQVDFCEVVHHQDVNFCASIQSKQELKAVAASLADFRKSLSKAALADFENLEKKTDIFVNAEVNFTERPWEPGATDVDSQVATAKSILNLSLKQDLSVLINYKLRPKNNATGLLFAETSLNGRYKKKMEEEDSHDYRETLEKSQKAWLEYRDAMVKFLGEVHGQNSQEHDIQTDLLTRLNRQREKQIKNRSAPSIEN